MNYLSVCSGIEAATAAWQSRGWQAVAFSEIEKFPSTVLAYHYPNVPNWGDMTKFKEWPDAEVDVLVGGTPCQSFSVAGLRKGLADPRGNLALTYLAIADKYRPTWLVWENVPGVLSADGGRAFGAILAGMGKLGYGFAYRVLDAQYVRTCRYPGAVPQRRRRVFVVAHLGDWRRAAAVLFDPESLSGNPPPGREAGEAFATSLTERTRAGGRQVELGGDVAYALDNPGDGGRSQTRLVAHALRGEGFDASEDGTGRGTPIVPECANPLTHRMHKGINTTLDEGQTPIPVAMRESGQGYWMEDEVTGPLRAEGENRPSRPSNVIAQPVAFHNRQDPDISGDVTHPLGSMDNGMAVAFAENSRAEVRLCGGDGSVSAQLTTGGGKPGQGQPCVASTMAVRRLTPVECERLQGFPDNFTRIPWRNKPADQCPDGPRYKALGNSMAVNCMEWLGERIGLVHSLD